METYHIEIAHDGKYTEVMVSDNTPAMLADEIKAVVRNYFRK